MSRDRWRRVTSGKHATNYAQSLPSRFERRRFARMLLLGNAGIFAIILGTVVLALTESRASYTASARQTAEALTRTVSLNLASQIKQVDNAMLSAVYQLNRLENPTTSDSREALRILGEQQALVPQAEAVRMTDSEGKVIDTEEANAIHVGDRDYFRAARSAPEQLIISEPLQGRILKHWGLKLARARTDARGHFLGIVSANLSAAHFVEQVKGVAIGRQGAVTLRSESLRLIARYSPGRSEPERGLGTVSMSNEAAAALLAAPEAGVFVSRTAADGVERMNAYQRIPGCRLLVVVGIATSEFYAPWKTQVMEMAGLAALLEAVVVWLSLRIYRQQIEQARSFREIVRLAAERGLLLDNELVGMLKLEGTVEAWHNKAFAALLGYPPGALAGVDSRTLYPDDAAYRRVMRGYRELSGTAHYRTQIQVRHKNGGLIWVDMSAAKLSELESLWMIVDISHIKATEAQAQHLARHDPLTGLANRTRLVESLEDRLRAARPGHRQIAVCYIDLDGFKGINDLHGHAAGDALLKEVALRMSCMVRATDLVARIGGDEFAAVLYDVADEGEVFNVLQRLLDRLGEPITVHGDAQVRIGASIGIALHPTHAGQAGELLALADEAMYRAKRSGKNRFVMCAPHRSDQAAVTETMDRIPAGAATAVDRPAEVG
jgi:diguanylate cyclase (GGDEF)-like protein/PAS domain S-box-containing protein